NSALPTHLTAPRCLTPCCHSVSVFFFFCARQPFGSGCLHLHTGIRNFTQTHYRRTGLDQHLPYTCQTQVMLRPTPPWHCRDLITLLFQLPCSHYAGQSHWSRARLHMQHDVIAVFRQLVLFRPTFFGTDLYSADSRQMLRQDEEECRRNH